MPLTLYSLLLCLIFIVPAAGAAGLNAEKEVDFKRFTGTWYELATKPSWVQRDCVATESIYTQLDSGKLKVENRCRDENFDGDWQGIQAQAWSDPDSNEQGRLKLQLFWPFKADLWILKISEDYQTAIIGTPSLSNVWILSRTRQLPDDKYTELIKFVSATGFDIKLLEKTKQPVIIPI